MGSYEDMTVTQLRDALKAAGKPVYGTKAELVERLASTEQGSSLPSGEPQPPVGYRGGFAWTVTTADDTYIGDDAWHVANKYACLREADARGLLPIGGVDAVQVDAEHLPDGRVELTYMVPVARSS